MFDIFFGWRKASRCKKLILRVQCRLKLLKNKRESIIRQLEGDVAQLIKAGKDQSAFARVEQLLKDQCLKAAYDLLDHFCEFIIVNLPYIRKHKDCPNNVGEAVSTLLFASARCGDLPELSKLRKLFGERYGQKFATTSVELLPGNLVNRQMIEKLCVKSIPDDVKFRLEKEIARDDCLQLGPPEIDSMLALQHDQVYDASLEKYDFQWKENVKERDIQLDYYDTEGAQMQLSSGIDIVEPINSNLVVKLPKYDQLSPLYELKNISQRDSDKSNSRSCCSSRGSSISVQHKVERLTSTASESSNQFSKRTIVYLDDIEEFQPNIKEDVGDKDQRLFMFKSTIPPQRNNSAGTGLLGYYEDSFKDDLMAVSESFDGKTSSRGSSNRRKLATKRLKRRYLSTENQKQCSQTLLTSSMLDTECALYYGRQGVSSPDGSVLSCESRRRKKHQRKVSAETESVGSSLTSRGNKRGTKISVTPREFDKHRRNEECKSEEAEGMDCQASYVSSRGSCSRTISPQTQSWERPPYMRAVTMPPERPKGPATDLILRSASFQLQQPDHSSRSSSSSCPHIHPKLPDYDDLAARFKAMKETTRVNSMR
ncbi:hypothetical protein GIB67_024999 [Kingdonia uniflora]|uniref:Regulator of Vps4 activity in the MVB pathway protein n=1 Tax=Kingdonia uniflora TaxID=39325 RepID=A0A7J7N7L3_9MAGN|nr:hypothetical protein GIB67_024999 [Kingdonia uniflora]